MTRKAMKKGYIKQNGGIRGAGAMAPKEPWLPQLLSIGAIAYLLLH
jgi:hypothetical protein